MKTNFNTRKFMGGAYATTISAVVIAIVVVINLVFTKLNYTVDLTDNSRFSLTEETITMLSELEDEITFYYLTPNGMSDDIFDKILSQYKKYGDTISLVIKDPVMNPKFASQYTSESVEQYSIIVVNETNGRSRYVPYSDMLIEEYSIDYTTYQYYSEVTGLDVEGQLNSAIGYVTSEELPTVYEVSGHGMQELGSSVVSMLEKANFQVKSGTDALDLLTTTEIPEDCDVLLLQTPETDFTETEVSMLSDYMAGGGKLIFVVSYVNADHPKLLGLLKQYGIELSGGLILEGSSQYYMQAPYVLLPQTVSHDIINEISDSKYIAAQYSSPMYFTEDSGGNLTQSAFLTSSSSSYEKGIEAQSFYQEEGDAAGRFNIGVHVEDSDTGAEAVVFSSYYIFNEVYASGSTFANIDILINSVNVLADAQSNTVAVRTVDLTEETYLTLTDAQCNFWGLITVVLLPLACLVIGIVWVVYRRKHA